MQRPEGRRGAGDADDLHLPAGPTAIGPEGRQPFLEVQRHHGETLGIVTRSPRTGHAGSRPPWAPRSSPRHAPPPPAPSSVSCCPRPSGASARTRLSRRDRRGPGHVDPDQFGRPAADVEDQQLLGLDIDQRRTAGHGQPRLLLRRDDIQRQPGLAVDPAHEIAAVGGAATGFGGHNPVVADPVVADLARTDAQRLDRPVLCRIGQKVGALDPLAQACTARLKASTTSKPCPCGRATRSRQLLVPRSSAAIGPSPRPRWPRFGPRTEPRPWLRRFACSRRPVHCRCFWGPDTWRPRLHDHIRHRMWQHGPKAQPRCCTNRQPEAPFERPRAGAGARQGNLRIARDPVAVYQATEANEADQPQLAAATCMATGSTPSARHT